MSPEWCQPYLKPHHHIWWVICRESSQPEMEAKSYVLGMFKDLYICSFCRIPYTVEIPCEKGTQCCVCKHDSVRNTYCARKTSVLDALDRRTVSRGAICFAALWFQVGSVPPMKSGELHQRRMISREEREHCVLNVFFLGEEGVAVVTGSKWISWLFHMSLTAVLMEASE